MSAPRNFRLTRFGGPSAGPQSLGIPTAAYPGRVATDSDLIVAVDRQQTSLLLPLGATDTTMTVLNASMVRPYNLLSIDDEIVKTTGAAAGNVVPISRGFDGTVAAAHASGAVVAGLVDAWHHNALVAEVEAIETALGPNLGNIAHGIPSDLVSTNFIYPPQTPGGSLAAGSNSITMNPVPPGLAVGGTAYISGGTGTAEAVPVTGVSGSTVIVTCANTHSGAWTIQSATAGIQEAVNALPVNGGIVSIPTGLHVLYTTIHVGNGTPTSQSTRNSIYLRGFGLGCSDTVGLRAGASNLQWYGPNGGIMLQIDGPIVGVRVENLMFDGAPASTTAATAMFSMHAYGFRYQDLSATKVNGFAFDIQARGNQTGFAAGSAGVVDGMYTASLASGGSGLNVGGPVYGTGYMDVAQASFRNLYLQVGTGGVGVQLQFVDSCDFNFVITMNGAIGLKVINPSGPANNFPSSITFKQSYFGGTTAVSLPAGWHPSDASDIYGGLQFMPWGAEVGPPPDADGVYGFTDNNQFFNFKLSVKPLTLATGPNHNVAIGSAGMLRISGPSGAYSITGFTGGRDGRVLMLVGNTGGVLTIKNQDPGSAAGNRISVPGVGDVILSNGTQSAIFAYDGIDACWFFMGGK